MKKTQLRKKRLASLNPGRAENVRRPGEVPGGLPIGSRVNEIARRGMELFQVNAESWLAKRLAQSFTNRKGYPEGIVMTHAELERAGYSISRYTRIGLIAKVEPIAQGVVVG